MPTLFLDDVNLNMIRVMTVMYVFVVLFFSCVFLVCWMGCDVLKCI